MATEGEMMAHTIDANGKPVIGFVGIGSMGGAMARRLIGFENSGLVVYDTNLAAAEPLLRQGAILAGSPREVGDRAELIFSCLPTNEAHHAAIAGAAGISAGGKVRIIVNLGTTGAQTASALAAEAQRHGVTLLDAPVSGGRDSAERGTLAVMVSGSGAAFAEVALWLGRIGTTVEFVGEKVGVAQTLKLLNNLLSMTAFLVTGEAIVMGVKAGLDPEVMLRVINAGSGRNSATADKFPKAVLTRSFEIGSLTSVTAKDIKLCLEEAALLGVPMWVGEAVGRFYDYAMAKGAGPRDRTTLVQYIETLAGVEIPKTR